MNIPDRVSDMDSIPETISLARSVGIEARVVAVTAARQDAESAVIRMAGEMDKCTKALREFSDAWVSAEVVELDHLYSL